MQLNVVIFKKRSGGHDTFSSSTATFPPETLACLHECISDMLANPEGLPQPKESLLCVHIDQLPVSQLTVSGFNFSAQLHAAQRLCSCMSAGLHGRI